MSFDWIFDFIIRGTWLDPNSGRAFPGTRRWYAQRAADARTRAWVDSLPTPVLLLILTAVVASWWFFR